MASNPSLFDDARQLLVWAEKYESTPMNMLALEATVNGDWSPMLALRTGVVCARALLETEARDE